MKWIEVPSQIFKKYNKDNLCLPIQHKLNFKYYGNASKMAQSKKEIKTNQYYINYNNLIKWNPVAELIIKDFNTML